MPPATITSWSPARIIASAISTARMLDAQTLLIVSAGTSIGKPGADGGLARGRLARAGLEHLAHDHVLDVAVLDVHAFERRRGSRSRPARSPASTRVAPPSLPNGVRTAETMTERVTVRNLSRSAIHPIGVQRCSMPKRRCGEREQASPRPRRRTRRVHRSSPLLRAPSWRRAAPATRSQPWMPRSSVSIAARSMPSAQSEGSGRWPSTQLDQAAESHSLDMARMGSSRTSRRTAPRSTSRVRRFYRTSGFRIMACRREAALGIARRRRQAGPDHVARAAPSTGACSYSRLARDRPVRRAHAIRAADVRESRGHGRDRGLRRPRQIDAGHAQDGVASRATGRNARRAAERGAVTDERRLVLVALGGNALLRRGEPMTAAAQRANVRVAAEALAPVARRHRLVLSHGNGPQVGLLALQGAAYAEVEPYPLDILAAETEGMIGYLIEQELGNLLPFEVPFATILTMVEVDPDDPAFDNPTKFIGPGYDEAEAQRARDSSMAGRSSSTAIAGAASSPPLRRRGSSSTGRSSGCSRRARSSSARAAAASPRCTSQTARGRSSAPR